MTSTTAQQTGQNAAVSPIESPQFLHGHTPRLHDKMPNVGYFAVARRRLGSRRALHNFLTSDALVQFVDVPVGLVPVGLLLGAQPPILGLGSIVDLLHALPESTALLFELQHSWHSLIPP